MGDVKLSSLRVETTLDASGYERGAQQKVAADQAMIASDKAAASSSSDTQRRVSDSASGFERLRRSLDPAYAAQANFTRGQTTLQRALDQGKISADEHGRLIDLLGRRYSDTGDKIEGLRHKIGIFADAARGDLGGVARSAATIANEYGLLGGGAAALSASIAALAAMAGIGIAAQLQYAASWREVSVSLKAGGDAAGVTRDQLEGLAQRTSAGSLLSVKEARTATAGLVGTGRLSGQNLENAAGLVPDFAAFTGQGAGGAASSLARMLAEPLKAIEQLRAERNLGNQADVDAIKNLTEQGNLYEADARLIEVLSARIKGLADEDLGSLERAWEAAKKAGSNFFDWLGSRGAAPSSDDRMALLRKQLGDAQAGGRSDIYLPGGQHLTTGAAQSELDTLTRQQDEARRGAAVGAQAASDRDLESAATAAARAQDPLIEKREALTNASVLLFSAIQHGIGDIDAEGRAFKSLTTVLGNLGTPLQEAQKQLDIARQVAAVAPSQRGTLQARLSTQFAAERNPQTAGQATALGQTAGEAADLASTTAARDAVTQANLQATAQQRLATAAGVSSTALRQAAINNQVAAFAYQHGAEEAEHYRQAIARASEADRSQQVSSTVLSLNQEADAQKRLAAAAAKGPAAFREAELENRAFSEALKAGAQGSREFTAAYEQLLPALQRTNDAQRDARSIGIDTQLQQELDLRQRELALMHMSAEERAKELADLKLRQDLINDNYVLGTQAFNDELAKRQQIAQQIAVTNVGLTRATADQKEFKQEVQEAGQFGLSAFQTLASATDTWHDKLTKVGQAFADLIIKLTVMKPLEDAITQLSGSAGATGSGGIFGAIFSGIFGGASPAGPTAAGASSAGFGLGANMNGFASGGDFDGMSPIMVGEQGPEIITPRAAGTVIPNGSLGGTQQHFYIDARGSSPGVEAKIDATIRQLAAVNASIETRAIVAFAQARRMNPNILG